MYFDNKLQAKYYTNEKKNQQRVLQTQQTGHRIVTNNFFFLLSFILVATPECNQDFYRIFHTTKGCLSLRASAVENLLKKPRHQQQQQRRS
jgi:hypothetical protein